MRLRVVSATALAFILIVVAAPSAYSLVDDDIPAPVTATANIAPTSATAAPETRIEVAKPKPRVKPRAVQPPQPIAQPNFFAEFNLLRLFAISAVPRSTVAFSANYKAGTVVIHTQERRLYLVLGNGQALRYGIGVGRDGFTWRGVQTVSAKREWPSWTPPPEMLKRRPNLPRHMVGGRDNPLGARAIYLGDSLYRIHGTNEYDTIGTGASSGCFRMTNDDVVDLYNRVRLGATVIVQ
jgi:lipoprotein-anchoring transpeptidase ErfK/SrfK